MTETFILEHVGELAFTLLGAAVGFLWKKLIDMVKEQKHLRDGVLAMLHDRLYQSCTYYIKMGSPTTSRTLCSGWEPNGSSSAGRWRSTSTRPIPCEMAGIRGFGVVYSGCHIRASYNVRSSTMKRRKDNKGRALKEGESQRKDGRYQYRWTDRRGERHILYAMDLKTLRDKEDEVEEMRRSGINVLSANMTVLELMLKFAEIRKLSIRKNTRANAKCIISVLKEHPIADRDISSVTRSEGKMFVIGLYEDGYAYGTIENFKVALLQAFGSACEDKLIAENPFRFTLSKVIPKEEKEKAILTEEQYERLIDFCRENRRLTKHLDEVIILHETGLRVSEFCGLTMDDVDLERNVVRVEHQLLYYAGKLFIEAPKTKQGVRTIPMSAKAKEAFEHMIAIRPRLDKEPVVDGYSGFFQITPYGKPRRTPSVEANLKKIIMKYNESHSQDTLPLITPHSLRHMFCTRLVLSGMNLKAIQYIMGHKKMEMTLELYSHMNEKNAIKAFQHYMASDTNFDTNSHKNM